VTDRQNLKPLSPLQGRLRDKALAGVSAERARVLEPVHAVLRARASTSAYTLDEAMETALARKIEVMLPDRGGLIVGEAVLPEHGPAIADTLTGLADGQSADCKVILWFEATIHSQSALVSFGQCHYGIFTGDLGDLALAVGAIKSVGDLPIGWMRMALISADDRWMIWIDGNRAILCTPP
jgi:hypothetical protein